MNDLWNKKWGIPLVLIALLTPFSGQHDLAITRLFYNVKTGFSEHYFFQWIYEYGVYPALIICAGAGAMYLLSFPVLKWKKWRPHALFLFLVYVVGSGLIVNAVLKDHWGRPRPKQVTEFGGEQPFRPYYSPNFFSQPEPSKSFPCGHCTSGFYFLALVIVGRRMQRKSLVYLGVLLTIALGGLLSLARIAQGGHFFMDVILAGVIMWGTALAFEWLIYEEIYP